MYLPSVCIAESTRLQVHNHKAAQPTMEENKINTEPIVVNA
jgi:hypothetical protein